ncbi:1,4-dihydroxy-2-naphthoate octaprenyltransferase [Bacteroides graminisolvens DSM 19988 = JCM 15093]|uniref:1,4-dihydroxy-2-naphthoate octaprenyltransferase n=1 Tax=Bacteroides graminisolvens DSM 19988 = JCM 15093 TaxID=1121097 RepID=A0A069D3W5_9BACE|nr:1,4-dihydroxy-2-naphthoate octaprenyltransferase [Bacteroides graminisolvens DSM 19988 = JCM 15093]
MSDPIQPNSIKAWILAARPKTLAGALTPVLIGSALASCTVLFIGYPYSSVFFLPGSCK